MERVIYNSRTKEFSTDDLSTKTVEKIKSQAFGFQNHKKYYIKPIVKIKNFSIKGTKNSVAQTYAKENGFKFSLI